MSQMVSQMFSGAGSDVSSALSSTGDAVSSAVGNPGVSSSASTLSNLRSGSSVFSALTTYAAGREQSRQDELNAQSETMAASGELLDAQQKATAIQGAYNATVAQQQAVASASGFDVSSGSVQQARAWAQKTADTQTQIVNSNGQMNAALRRARAAAYTGQAQMDREAGFIGGLGQIATGVTQAIAMGG